MASRYFSLLQGTGGCEDRRAIQDSDPPVRLYPVGSIRFTEASFGGIGGCPTELNTTQPT